MIQSGYTPDVYTGNNSTDTFAYNFKVLDDDHILVESVVIATGARTTLTKGTHYSVTGVGEDAGGNIVFVTAPASTVKVVFSLNIPARQSTNYENQGEYFAEDHEDSFDLLTLMVQQIREELARAPKVTIESGDTGDDLIDSLEASVAAAAASASTASGHATTASSAATAAGAAQTAAEAAETNAEAAATLASNWAQKTSGTVDGAGTYSAKEWAVGTQIRGVASAGSAKDWASYTGGTVDGTEYSAKYYAQQAAAGTTDATIPTTDVTTNNVSSTKHGWAPKSPADATKFLNGAATPDYAAVKDSDLALTDITTNDVTTSKHGFVPKAPNDTTKFLRGDGTWAVPSAGLSAASQAEMEAGSSNTVAVTPGRLHFHPGSLKAYATIDVTGAATILASYNVSSVTDHGAGDFTVTWATAFSSANYACVVSARRTSSTTLIAQISETADQTASAARIAVYNTSGSGADPSRLNVIAGGDHA